MTTGQTTGGSRQGRRGRGLQAGSRDMKRPTPAPAFGNLGVSSPAILGRPHPPGFGAARGQGPGLLGAGLPSKGEPGFGNQQEGKNTCLGLFFFFFDSLFCLSGLCERLCVCISLLVLPCSVFLSLSLCLSLSLSLCFSLGPPASSCGKSQNSASGSWPVSLILDIWGLGLAGEGWSLSRVSRWPALPVCQSSPLAPIPHNRVFILFPPHLPSRPAGPF